MDWLEDFKLGGLQLLRSASATEEVDCRDKLLRSSWEPAVAPLVSCATGSFMKQIVQDSSHPHVDFETTLLIATISKYRHLVFLSFIVDTILDTMTAGPRAACLKYESSDETCQNASNATKSSSTVQQLVPLFSSFPPLNQLSVHLLRHLLVSFLFLFGLPAVFDGLNSSVPFLLLFFFHFQFSCLGHLLDLVLLLAFRV